MRGKGVKEAVSYIGIMGRIAVALLGFLLGSGVGGMMGSIFNLPTLGTITGGILFAGLALELKKRN